MKQIFYILSFLFTLGLFAQNQVLFEKANTLYNDGKYAEAIDNYNEILKSEKHSADFYFNLANAHYKLNNIAPSIYYYEKLIYRTHKKNPESNIKNYIEKYQYFKRLDNKQQ